MIPSLRARAQAEPAANADDLVTVRGRVLGPDGKPFAGARVVSALAFPVSVSRGRPNVLSVAQSGADGRFEISFSKTAASVFSMDLHQSGAELWKKTNIAASAPGLGIAWSQFDKVDGNGDLVLRLVADLALEGRIVDLEGRPIAGVNVIPTAVVSHILSEMSEFYNPPADYGSISNPLQLIGVDAPVVTDAEGRFRISGLGRDRLIPLDFQSPRVAMRPISATTQEGGMLKVTLGSDKEGRRTYYGNKMELTAAPAVTVTGVVRDVNTKKPIAGVRVKIVPRYSRFDPGVMTDEQGRFRLEGLERVPTEIVATSMIKPYLPSIMRLTPPASGGAVVLDFELHAGIWITGTVTEKGAGRAVPAEIDYFPLASNKAINGNALLREGRAQSVLFGETQPDGTYRLAGLPGPGILAVRSGDALYLRRIGADQIKDRTPAGKINTYRPDFNERNYNEVRELRLADDAASATADFQLDPGNTVHVACVDPDGKPLPVSVRGSRATTMSTQFTESLDGQFDVVGLPGDEKRLLYIVSRERKLGKVIVMSFADAAGGRLPVKLEPLATVTGRLLNSDGDAVKGGNLRADTRIDEVREGNQIMVLIQNSGPDGRFTLDLPAGCNYIIGATHSPYGGLYKWVNENLAVTGGVTKEIGDFRVSQEMR